MVNEFLLNLIKINSGFAAIETENGQKFRRIVQRFGGSDKLAHRTIRKSVRG